MINSIKQEIVDILLESYPDYTIYDEDVPQDFKSPSFLITLIKQEYNKRINTKYKSLLSFDVAYFSELTTDIKTDCQDKQTELFRAFDLIGTYRVQNKQATIVDNVLHFTFDINYSEVKVETVVPMQTQTQTTNTNL